MKLKPGDLVKNSRGNLLIVGVHDNSVKDNSKNPSKYQFICLNGTHSNYAEQWFIPSPWNKNTEHSDDLYTYLGNINGIELEKELLSSFEDPIVEIGIMAGYNSRLKISVITVVRSRCKDIYGDRSPEASLKEAKYFSEGGRVYVERKSKLKDLIADLEELGIKTELKEIS